MNGKQTSVRNAPANELTLYHCANARSFRVLWTLEELGLPYRLIMLPFPPRIHAKHFKDINPLGTIPAFFDGEMRMTESVAISQYLCTRFGPTPLAVERDEADYGPFLNWLYFGEATLTFPQTLVLRYAMLEPRERRNPAIVEDYTSWYLGRLRAVETALAADEHLCAGRFTTADISVGFALLLSRDIGLDADFTPQVAKYWARLQQRDGYRRAVEAQKRGGEEQGIAAFVPSV